MNIRDTYTSWSDVPPWLRLAVDAYDAARRDGSSEPAMSERNKCSIAPMVGAALAAANGLWSTSPAVMDVIQERCRQVEGEGWTPEHDDEYAPGVLAGAGACYAIRACKPANDLRYGPGSPPGGWPWAPQWWKPGLPRRMLIKAAALIIAEIERLDRLAARP